MTVSHEQDHSEPRVLLPHVWFAQHTHAIDAQQRCFPAPDRDPSFKIDDAQVSTLKYGAQYFETLKRDGKDPVYYGPTVTANDAGKVLLRWKLSDGQYRVVLGDLQIKDVDAEQLSKLEAP